MFNNETIALPKRNSAVPSAPCKCWTLLRSFFGFPGAVKWALDCGPHHRWDDPSRTADLLPSFTPWPLAVERFTSDPETQAALLLVGRVRHLHVLPPEELGFRDPERVERGAENHAIIVICLSISAISNRTRVASILFSKSRSNQPSLAPNLFDNHLFLSNLSTDLLVYNHEQKEWELYIYIHTYVCAYLPNYMVSGG